MAKSSVEAARYNMEANGVTNVFLARMASEEFAETMRARGTRRRLEGLGPWEELRLRTILVDPPRAGLDGFTVQLLTVGHPGEGEGAKPRHTSARRVNDKPRGGRDEVYRTPRGRVGAL